MLFLCQYFSTYRSHRRATQERDSWGESVCYFRGTVKTCDCREELIVVEFAEGTASLEAESYQVLKFDGFKERIVAETEHARPVAFVEGKVGAERKLRRIARRVLVINFRSG